MHKRTAISLAGVSVLLAGLAFAQGQQGPSGMEQRRNQPSAAARTDAESSRPDVTYGNVKELTPGQKVVVAIENAPDKSYNLTKRDTSVAMPSDLKVGDPVAVTERDVNGRKQVAIEKRPGMDGGERAAAGQGRTGMAGERAADATYGRIKEYTPGQKIVIDVDNALDKSYDLTDRDRVVTMSSTLKQGDPVVIRERKTDGKDHVTIAYHSDPTIRHGDNDPDYRPGGTSQGEAARTAPGAAPMTSDTDTARGRIKELTPGKRVVISINNAPDKTYDLTSGDTSVSLGSELRVGDPVTVSEHETNGKKTVQIMKQPTGGEY